MTTTRARCVVETQAFLGEGPVWNEAEKRLDWVDILAPALHRSDPASGADRVVELGELVGAMRALLVAKLDSSADGDGIPADLWQSLLAAADAYPPDRILSAIDVFAETEGRMKWSTNKRLHFELGLIKAVQALGEVRLSDVIKVLARGADAIGDAGFPVAAPAPAIVPVAVPARAPEPEPEPAYVPEPEPTYEPEPAYEAPPIREPEPEPPPVAKVWEPEAERVTAPVSSVPRKSLDALTSRFENMIAAAPEHSEPPPPLVEPPPFKSAEPAAPPEPPKPARPQVDESFHRDPLVEHALAALEGRVVG